MKINNKKVESISINDKEVQSITRVSDNAIIYNKKITLWEPTLDGTNGARYKWSYSESNGEAIGKGFVLNGGWDNTGLWECSFQFKHDNIRYTGIVYIVDANSTYNGGGGCPSTAGRDTWEGTFPGTSNYAGYSAGAVGYFDVKVTKIDETHVRVTSKALNKDSGIIEIPQLENWTKLSIGARHNDAGSSYGPCRIKDVKVMQL